MGVILVAKVELQTAQGVDLLHGDGGAVLRGGAVNGSSAGAGPDAADLDGCGSGGAVVRSLGSGGIAVTAAGAADEQAEAKRCGKQQCN